MNIKRFLLIAIAMLAGLYVPVYGQIVNAEKSSKQIADSIREEMDNRPYFSLFKDIYFVGGTVLGGKPTEYNSDVKFQISFQQRLTKSVLPWNTYLYLFYTQKAMWNVFERSLPFHDLNFNPGIGLSRYIILKNQLIGKITMMIEHESNGRDGTASRSWNKISWAGEAYVSPNLMAHAKFWIPIIDGQYNKDILNYMGISQAGFQAKSSDDKWVLDMTLVKRKGWNLNFNTIVQLGYRINHNSNQFIMLQYYNGYGESMLDYNQYHSRIRFGLLIRPRFFSDF
ncbi:MAG: phospholipase A [Muribaculaceae bacterium]|nr:phospholipase A [Muribaculaceae bacterium]